MWVQHYLGCKGVNIDGIRVHSLVNHNNDGIDIDSCDRVRISNCDIISGDDAIVLKSTTPLACRNVAVTNCLLSSRTNAFKLGTESVGGFADITFSNSVIHDTRGSGIALEEVDGGACERIGISNITMINARGGIFVRLGNRARPHLAEGPGGARGTWKMPEGVPQPEVPMGSMSNILISNVQARGVGKIGCSITGLPGHPVRNITLDNIRIQYTGGGTSKDAARVPEEIPEAYPSNRMFGVLPAYGFFVRHVENVRFQNIDVDFEKQDARPAFIFDDARELDLTSISGKLSEPVDVLIKMTNIQNAMVRACRPRHPGKTFLHLRGGGTRGVAILDNDFRHVKKPVEYEKEVNTREVFMNANWMK